MNNYKIVIKDHNICNWREINEHKFQSYSQTPAEKLITLICSSLNNSWYDPSQQCDNNTLRKVAVKPVR